MKVINGVFSGMVMQRNAQGLSRQAFRGTCQSIGDVIVSVTQSGKILKGLNNMIVGQAANGVCQGVLAGIPAGGPYEIVLVVGTESIQVCDVYVGDVWLLAGQSNMEGFGNLTEALNPRKEVRAFYLNNQWAVAQDPLHRFDLARAGVHLKISPGWQPNPGKGVGPGVAFGQVMFKATGIPQGLIASAHGGTSMSQWDPALKKLGSDSLYGAMLERFKLNGGRIAGLLWYQGCADTTSADVPLYTPRMIVFIKAIRKDFHQPELPVAMVQIGRLTDRTPSTDLLWMSIREQQRCLSKRIKNLTCISVMDLDTDDPVHISGKDQIIVGRRLAEAMCTLRHDPGALPPPIELKAVKLITLPKGFKAIQVEFKNVAGKLQSAGRPSGFGSLQDSNGVFKCCPAGHKVLIPLVNSISLGAPLQKYRLNKLGLCYGYGTNPYCNILDSAGRSLPAFGPLTAGTPLLTDYARNVEVSDPVFVKETMEQLMPLAKRHGLVFHQTPTTDFYVVPEDRAKYATPEDKIRYYRTTYNCPEAMDVALLIGYDGPVILYDNGTEIYRDPNGTNPIIAAGKAVKQHWTKGRHELVFALALNHGTAWGISLRIERIHIKRQQSSEKIIPLPIEFTQRK